MVLLVECSPRLLQQGINRIGPRIGDQAAQSIGVRPRCWSDRRRQRSPPQWTRRPIRSRAWPSSTKIQVSGSASSAQLECSGKIDPLQNKMLARDQKCSVVRKESWTGLGLSRPGIGSGDGVVFVQLALPPVVEHAEGRIAVLLYLRKHDAARRWRGWFRQERIWRRPSKPGAIERGRQSSRP